jgi:hypothetical protein
MQQDGLADRRRRARRIAGARFCGDAPQDPGQQDRKSPASMLVKSRVVARIPDIEQLARDCLGILQAQAANIFGNSLPVGLHRP